jgi:hypothetical protein
MQLDEFAVGEGVSEGTAIPGIAHHKSVFGHFGGQPLDECHFITGYQRRILGQTVRPGHGRLRLCHISALRGSRQNENHNHTCRNKNRGVKPAASGDPF